MHKQNLLDTLLRALALTSVEPILFANLFFGQLGESLIVYTIFSLPVALILVSVFRPYKIFLGSFWAYTSAIFILVPLGVSSMVTEKFFPVYHEYRVWILFFILLVSLFVVRKFVKTTSDEKEENDYFKNRAKL